jgi:2',3'-cyclic-nucleotide 2'-phosphodiesterase/3'-nucleotidase
MTRDRTARPLSRAACTTPPRIPLAATGGVPHLSLVAGAEAASQMATTGGPTGGLRILATTDLHAQLLSYDYTTNRPSFGMGLAQAASLIAEAREGGQTTILLDNGDFLQGSALAELASYSGRRRTHPAIAAFNALGYDAVALGNHEFNYGLGLLQSTLVAARFPALSANVTVELGATPLSDRHLTAPYALLRRDIACSDGRPRPITLGILGLTPPEIMAWDHAHLAGRVAVRPMVEAARAWVPALRDAGADLVICLAHTGIGDLDRTNQAEGQAADIAEVPGIDVLVAGHSHEVFPNALTYIDPRIDPAKGRIAGKPAVQPGHSGSHLGIVDLELAPDASGGWQIAGARARTASVSEAVAGLPRAAIRRHAAPLRAALDADHRAVLTWTRQPIGRTTVPLSTQFALVADVQAMRLVAAAKRAHVRRLIAGRPEAELPILAAVTPFRVGGRGGPQNFTDIPPGPLSLRHVFDIYPFPNTLAATVLTGAQIKARLEQAVDLFQQIVPGQPDQRLFDPRVSTYGFETIIGLSYRVNLTLPKGGPGRIEDLRLDGAPLAPDARLVLATSSYRQNISGAASGQQLIVKGPLVTQILAGFIGAQRQIGAETGPGWALAPVPGASVLIDVGVGALRQTADVAHLDPELQGITEAGFHRFRLHL